MIHDAGSQGKLAVDHGVRKIDAAAPNNASEEGAIQFVRVACFVSMSEAHGAKCYRSQPLEFWLGINELRQQMG